MKKCSIINLFSTSKLLSNMFQLIGGIASLFVSMQSDKIDSITQEESKETPSLLVRYEDYPETEIIDLIIYPCRGVEGIHLNSAHIEASGFLFDREWFLLQRNMARKHIQKNGKRWVSINRCDKVAQIKCRFEDEESKDGKTTKYLIFSHQDQEQDLRIDTTKPATEEEYEVFNFEKMRIIAYSEGDDAAAWFTKIIGIDVVLTRSLDKNMSSTHKIDLGYQFRDEDIRRSGHTHAAIHLVNQKSVDRLKSLVQEPDVLVTAEQFRPNIVIAGVEADDEDDMRELVLTSNDVTFRVVKLCVRWKTPMFNKSKGHLNESGEPFTTLRKYKTHEVIGTIFGTFLQADQECDIKIGDKVKYIKKTKDHIKFIDQD